MNNRRLVQLKEIAETQTGPFGSQLHEEDYVSVGTPIVTVEHLGETGFIPKNLPLVSDEDKERLSKYSLEEGDIVFSRVGSIDRCTYVTKNEAGWLFSGRCLRVRINKNANARFVSFYFRQRYFKEMMLNISVGATMPSLNTSLMDNIPIYLPELEEQNKIASLLGSLDSKISLNNRINAELEAIAKTVYDYWFVQFDFPNAEGKPYKSSSGKMVWCEELKREIPEGWEVKSLGSEIEIQRGISYTSTEINGEGIPMISLNSFNLNGTYKAEGIKTYSGKYADKNLAIAGELLIAATDVTRNADIIGKAILVPDYYSENLVFSMDIAKVISSNIPSPFLMMLFNSKHYHNYIKWFASGTLVLHLNIDGVNRYVTELPPKSLLDKFDDFYKPIAKRIYMTTLENQHLSSVRDWLLPMLMNGQVSVGEAVQEFETLIAAEPKTDYKCSKSQWENYHKIESVYVILWANKLLGVQQGEMALAKDTYLVDKLAGIDTGFTFAKHNWGSYDPTFKKTINNKQYFVRRNFENSKATYFDLNDNEKLLARIPETTKEAVRTTIEELHTKIFDKYHWSRKAEMKELYATVLKCIEDAQSTDLNVIRQAMKDWKTPKQDFSDKAAKFSEQQTKEALDMIVKEGWDMKVMKDLL